MVHKNPTSTLRGGFDYQDWWGLKLCGDWLSNPSSYQRLQFETAPEEVGAGRFYLDDIILLGRGGAYHLYQLKHRQQTSNIWLWEDFLSSTGRQSSLLQKWEQSIGKLESHKIGGASFITNAGAGDGIITVLENNKINLAKLRDQNANLYQAVLDQLGGEERATRFFAIFEFRFNQPDFPEIEEEVKNTFLQDLRATETGINNLLLQIHRECRKPQTQPLSLEQLKQWCEFDDPQPLKEDFFVPEDFQIFDERVHGHILQELKDSNGGIKVIVGKPGTGKSVYLSKLHEILSEQEIITVRHHYQLSPVDENPQERLNSDRVIEALKAQFKQYPDELGELAHKNSANISPREFIQTIASSLNQRNRAFVMIIDGLDHVIRHADAEELKTFLQSICFPQPGLWIVLGMQPVVSEHLPAIIHDKCPPTTWVEMSGLNRDAVERVVVKNRINLNLPDEDQGLSAFINKIFEVTQGNPLHLHYLLTELKIKQNGGLVTDYSVDRIVPYGGDIANYYSALWRGLNDRTKTVLFAIASVNFVFKRQQLLECISSFESNPAEVSQAFRSIQHLVKEDRKTQISVYHNSFQIFLLGQPQFEEQKTALKQNIKTWLENCPYENLKWAELRKIRYELGQPESLLEVDRRWLLEAIYHPRNSNQIDTQLCLASKAAFDQEDLAKAFLLAHARTYYLNALEFVNEASERVFAEAIQTNREALSDIKIGNIASSTLVLLASLANDRGDFATIEEVINELIERQHDQEYRRKGDGEMPEVARALVESIPYDRTHSLDRVYKYIKQFANLGWTPEFLSVYSEQLLKLDQVDRLRSLLAMELSREERVAIADQCAVYDLEHRSSEFAEFYRDSSSFLGGLVETLRRGFNGDLPVLPTYDSLPTKIPEFHSGETQKWARFFFNQFLIALLYELNGCQNDIETWKNGSPDIWCAKALAAIFDASRRISGRLQTESRIRYEDLFSPLLRLETLQWPENRDQLDLQHGLTMALSHILGVIWTVKRAVDDTVEINTEDLQTICGTPYYSDDHLLPLLISKNGRLLSEQAYKSLIDSKKTKIDGLVTYFHDRAVAYADLAALARLHNDNVAHELLLKAADNLLGYGSHKDVYLFEVLEAIDLCGLAGISREKIATWIERISPIVESVTDYTDGDETNHLSSRLADALGKYDRSSLYKSYYAHTDTEALFHAQDLFRRVITSFSYDTDAEIALGATAIDKGSFEALRSTAQQNNGAKSSLEMITDYLGNINYPPEHRPSEFRSDKYEGTDYSGIAPDQLEEKLEQLSFENRWSQTEYLQGWLSYWLKHENNEKVYRSIVSVVPSIGVHELSGELLDLLYPLAHVFDNEQAFQLLCRAQANDYGWGRYWTAKAKAQARWSFLKEKYPHRYLEFFKRSIAYGNRGFEENGRYVPLSRGVEFFILFGDLAWAESITEAAVTFSEQLMADIKLPPPMWHTEPYKHLTLDELDLLMQRLLWPSPLVRERTATALAWLLSSSSDRERIYRRYLNWIERQTLESVIAMALLPFFRAFHLRPNSDALSYMKYEEIAGSLPLGSALIHKLGEELALEMKVDASQMRFPAYVRVNPYPNNYQITSFFQKHIQSFLAPVYYERAKEIESRSGRDFSKQWSFTADQIIDANEIPLNADVGYFQEGRRGGTLFGMSTMLSEVYRSAFVRVLQQYFESGYIAEDFYLEYACATVPVDLTFWKVKPRRIPHWWPKSRRNDNLTIVPVGMEEPIERLAERSGTHYILFAEGAVTPENGWDGSDAVHSYSLTGFAYRVAGSDIPTAEAVAKELMFAQPSVTLIPSRADHPFSFLANYPDFYPLRTNERKIGDLLIYPLIVRVRDLTISLWQLFRDYHLTGLLTPNLHKDLLLESTEDALVYKTDEHDIAFVSDWLEGLKERNDRELPLPHGQWIEIKKDFLDQYLTSDGLRLAYLLKTTYKHKQYQYSDAANLDHYKLINVSSIILPFSKVQ